MKKQYIEHFLGYYYLILWYFFNKNKTINNKPITPGNGLPFYDTKSLKKIDTINGNFMWLFANYG